MLSAFVEQGTEGAKLEADAALYYISAFQGRASREQEYFGAALALNFGAGDARAGVHEMLAEQGTPFQRDVTRTKTWRT